jgi:hypothetical protein
MTGLAYMFDAASPPAEAPPGMAAVLGYIGGGRATNIWTLAQWQPFARLRQFPAWVPDFAAEQPIQSAIDASTAACKLGWASFQPDRRAIVCDLETLTERAWYASFAAETEQQGFTAVAYGSLSTVLDNAAAQVIVAAWPGPEQWIPGQTIHGHQYAAGISFGGTQVDYSVIDSWLLDRGGQGPRHT